MHYYKRHIGDYNKKAARLSMLQHGAYTLLIDACYDREKFPTFDEAIDWCWASSEAEIEAVKFVLNKFFTLTDSGEYIQSRIQEEIDKYHKNAETNKRIAMEREAKRRENNTKRERYVDEAPPNHKPLTNNHKPTTNVGRRFIPPSLTDVQDYFIERGEAPFPARSESEKFIDFYSSKGWMVGKNKMKDWKAAVRNWMKRNSNGSHQQNNTGRKLSVAERATEARKQWERENGAA